MLWWMLVVVTARPVVACSLGGSIVNRVECDLTGSPYTVTQDVVVQKGATLVLKPGVTLQFDPGVGITVKGVLEAEVRFQAGCGFALHYLECGDLNLPRQGGRASAPAAPPAPPHLILGHLVSLSRSFISFTGHAGRCEWRDDMTMKQPAIS
ncbi:Protein bark beetle [Portunus trituberculatus]|uniref:Protein bark beetle n=1 Tax=Portunus trituberculatus TaxID=210409 RepID=A0A5B7IHA3_PORTR|nr:Protein bark beetle [Portunus trituberculatus]